MYQSAFCNTVEDKSFSLVRHTRDGVGHKGADADLRKMSGGEKKLVTPDVFMVL